VPQRDSDRLNLPPPLILRPINPNSVSVIAKRLQNILFTSFLSAVSERELLHDEQFMMSPTKSTMLQLARSFENKQNSGRG
jgi:hypothetical protein